MTPGSTAPDVSFTIPAMVAVTSWPYAAPGSSINGNQVFNPAVTSGSVAWLAPTSVMTARIAKITVQWDF